jgi:hypothetical protein
MSGFKLPPTNGLLAGAAVIVGWWSYGWQGLVLALTVIVFWTILQFNRATRVMRNAAQRPIGTIDSVAMVQARLDTGLTLLEVLPITGSLGVKLNDRDEWQWTDVAGNDIVLVFRRGVLVRWAVARAEAVDGAEGTSPDLTADSDATPDFGPPGEHAPR